MANINILSVTSSAAPVVGTPQTMDGSQASVSIRATSYGTDGKIVIKGSADGVNFITLPDANTASALAEYSADTIININRLTVGWSIRADLEITSGTATGVEVIAGT